MLALTAVFALAGASQAPMQPPLRQAGLWEDRSTMMGVLTNTTQQCVDGKTSPSAVPETPNPPKGCSLQQTSSSSSREAKMTCADGGYNSMTLEAPDAEHRAFMWVQRDAVGRTMTFEMRSRWIGECPAEMRDGRPKVVKPLTDLRTGEPVGKPPS